MSNEAKIVTRQVSEQAQLIEKDGMLSTEDLSRPGNLRISAALLHRSFIKSYRDVVAYGIRIVMYLGTYSMPTTADRD